VVKNSCDYITCFFDCGSCVSSCRLPVCVGTTCRLLVCFSLYYCSSSESSVDSGSFSSLVDLRRITSSMSSCCVISFGSPGSSPPSGSSPSICLFHGVVPSLLVKTKFRGGPRRSLMFLVWTGPVILVLFFFPRPVPPLDVEVCGVSWTFCCPVGDCIWDVCFWILARLIHC
jgi:hypothetical protein